MKETFVVAQDMTLLELLNAVYGLMIRVKLMKTIFLFAVIIGIWNGIMALILPAGPSIQWGDVFIRLFSAPLFDILFFGGLISLAMICIRMLNPNFYSHVTYRFTRWGMEKSMKDTDVTRPWNKFLKIRETKHFFYLFISDNDAQIVQKRMFGSKEEAEQFRQFVSMALDANL